MNNKTLEDYTKEVVATFKNYEQIVRLFGITRLLREIYRIKLAV